MDDSINHGEFEEYGDDMFEDEDDLESEDLYPYQISNEAFLRVNNIVDPKALRDRLSLVSFYVAVYESFKATVIMNVQSMFSCPAKGFTFDNPQYEKTEAYKKNILNMVVGTKKNGEKIRGWQDKLKASMLCLRDKGAITNQEFDTFIELRDLRNNYVHKMAEYIVDISKNTIENYEKLRVLLALYKKIDSWYYRNYEIHFSGFYDNNDVEDIDAIECNNILINLFETMADNLNL